MKVCAASPRPSVFLCPCPCDRQFALPLVCVPARLKFFGGTLPTDCTSASNCITAVAGVRPVPSGTTHMTTRTTCYRCQVSLFRTSSLSVRLPQSLSLSLRFQAPAPLRACALTLATSTWQATSAELCQCVKPMHAGPVF